MSAVGETLEVRIGARAQDGEANAELLRFLAVEVLGMRQADIELDRGARSRHKVVLVDMHVASSDAKSRQQSKRGVESVATKHPDGGPVGGPGKSKRSSGRLGASTSVESGTNDCVDDERRVHVQSVLARLRGAMTK
jgi:uncharacterized protein YggU (UPF0235/DUF167 family)